MFNSRCVHTDVTCVRILNNCLAAGVGEFLHIYQLDKNTLIQKKKIFKGQNIFGIKPNSQTSKLIVYGGKNICLISLRVSLGARDMTLLETDTHHILSDWVLDAKWIESDTKIITAFMHNKITVWTANFTPQLSIKCEERCILYSAHICYDFFEQVFILSGTVFGEILLWKPFYENDNGLSPVLNRLVQHRGVLFSIDCNLDNSLICTVSDDRSAVLWKVNNPELLSSLNPTNSNQLQICVACQVYGHLSRVFRCLILEDFFITAGEDSLVIMWNVDGALLRKIDSHQGGPVWSLGYHSDRDIIISGGNDGAICMSKANPKFIKESISLAGSECPKIVGLLKSGNMICLSERAVLYHRRSQLSTGWKEIAIHSDLKKYSILQISPCKKMVALAGYEGQIYIYNETNNSGSLKLLYLYHLINKSRIFSLHWISCKTFLVSQCDGLISLCFIHKQKIHVVQTFFLPPSKERWPTCACLVKGDHIIMGDRKGNIHNFKIGTHNVINTIKKAHNYLGVTNLYCDNDGASSSSVVISLGRDGFVKRYKLSSDERLECTCCNKTKGSWLAALLEDDYLLSFSGNNFVISDLKSKVLFEARCGGGHRSWDYLRMSNDELTFSFIKQKNIHTIKLSNLEDLTTKNITEAYHAYDINCLKILNIRNKHVIIISGGEDTCLRLSTVLETDGHIQVLECLKVHLSSIRAITTHPLTINKGLNEYILFTAGGRAQIICWHLRVEVKDHIKQVFCTEKYNFYEPLAQDQGETRIMDLSTTNFNDEVFLFAACSDGFIKTFLVSKDLLTLKFHSSFLHSRHALTKLIVITTQSSAGELLLLASMATDGYVMFWPMSDIPNHDEPIRALNSFKIHQSAITSCSYLIKNNHILFLTGGDDNCIALTLFVLNDTEKPCTIFRVNNFQDQGIHCAQITGAYLCDNYFITSSIDQRIAISRWTCEEDQVKFSMLEKYDTTIADAQGLEVINNDTNLSIYVYGNGVEHLQVKLDKIMCAEL